MVTYEKADYKDWEKFRLGSDKNTISAEEFTLVCDLHSKYYNHKFEEPCRCSPKTIKRWIKDLNLIWENGVKED